MNILIVGNVLKDVYLCLDPRTESFETDKHGTSWLDFSFDASQHHFFNRLSNLGGAAVSLEVLQKMGLSSSISDSKLSFTDNVSIDNPPTCRYILVSNDNVSYLTPSSFKKTVFSPPSQGVDFLYLDRSAEIDKTTAAKITAYLDISPQTQLVVYVRNLDNPFLRDLLSRASLIFYENPQKTSNSSQNLNFENLDPAKLVLISETEFSYLDVSEKISVELIDTLTHLSAYSIISATILGSFILGSSVEDSLKTARTNLENAKLDSVLSLSELQELALPDRADDDLELIAANLVLPPKGILAADESGGSIQKKFAKLNIPDTYENRRDYRNIFFTTPGLENYVNGIILFDETARQIADNRQNFVNFITSRRIIPGIKVDQGLEHFPNSEETFTKGLTGLSSRLQEYYSMGLRFAKWRAAFTVKLSEQGEILTPTDYAIQENCRILAQYASKCQYAKIVPIVEPELVYDGDYTIEQSSIITGKILDCLFKELSSAKVNLAACILKVNMVLAGKQFKKQSTPQEVGKATAETLKNHVPPELAGVVFLSGGQTVDQATNNLAEVIKHSPFPWPVTFSFARALQDPALYAWQGDNANIQAAQNAFKERLVKNTNALQNPSS